jgi:hypothetical protein
MKGLFLRMLLVLAVVSFIGGMIAAEPLNDAQQRLLAKRAAQVDGYRKLAEMVKGLRIDSQTYVRDFVAESDQIRTGFDTFIKGARISGQPRYMPDGTCEVDVELSMQEIVTALTELARHCTFGHKHSFTEMTQFVQEKIIKATGSGVPRPEAMGSVVQPEAVSTPTKGIPGWEDVTAQGRLMAERAALVDAYRNMAETVKGIHISGQTYVRDFVAESDQIQTSLDTFIKGAKQTGPYRYLPDGEAEVEIEVTVQEIVHELTTIQQHLVQQGWGWRRDEFRTMNFDQIVAAYPAKVVRATGNGVVPSKYRLQQAPEPMMVPAPAAPSWAVGMVSAVGTGVPPEGVTGTEAKLMAERAAELDARRQLTEKIYGVHIDAQTTVRDFVVQNDMVKADVDTFMAGAVISEPRYLDDGSVEVTASIPLEELGRIIR